MAFFSANDDISKCLAVKKSKTVTIADTLKYIYMVLTSSLVKNAAGTADELSTDQVCY